MLITFDIRPEDEVESNIDIWIDVQTPPVLPLCEFLNHIYVLNMIGFSTMESMEVKRVHLRTEHGYTLL